MDVLNGVFWIEAAVVRTELDFYGVAIARHGLLRSSMSLSQGAIALAEVVLSAWVVPLNEFMGKLSCAW